MCCHVALVFAVLHLYNNQFFFCIASVHSFVILFKKSVIDKSVESWIICGLMTCVQSK